MKISAAKSPRCSGHEIDTSAKHFGMMRDSNDALDRPAELRQRMAEEGYLYLPQLLDREGVLEARREVCQRLLHAGYLSPDAPLMDAIAVPGKANGFMPELVAKGNRQLLNVLYDGPMMRFWESFLGDRVRHFDYTWFRTVFPGHGTASHCDVVYMGRGTPNLYTAWTPIGDVDLELGGLMMLEGSNNHARLRSGYCQMDVDAYCANGDGKDAWTRGTGGLLGKDANQIRRSLGGRWLTRESYRAGDVVLFSVFTVHAGLDNQSGRTVRLSSDSRYQPADEPADERWIGEHPAGHGPGGKKAMIC
jgi:Phytanoyl-CoA dioxygenase (PhyH)